MALEYELEIYRTHLMELLGVNNVNEGKFAVIKDKDLQGPFETYEAALEVGYERYGLNPFLVKKIERNETILYFSRPLL
jgi:hypothetical protein